MLGDALYALLYLHGAGVVHKAVDERVDLSDDIFGAVVLYDGRYHHVGGFTVEADDNGNGPYGAALEDDTLVLIVKSRRRHTA